MSSHYVGTAELKTLTGTLLGVLHRFPSGNGFVEYWMVADHFHLWDVGPAFRHAFESLGRNPTNDKLVGFKLFGKNRFQQAGVPSTQLRLWKHDIAAEPL